MLQLTAPRDRTVRRFSAVVKVSPVITNIEADYLVKHVGQVNAADKNSFSFPLFKPCCDLLSPASLGFYSTFITNPYFEYFPPRIINYSITYLPSMGYWVRLKY